MQGDNNHGNLHLLERINIDLTAQNSIVPSARNLSRFKVQGKLPSLHVNFSDSKYKTIMRLIDIAVPHFGGDDAAPKNPPDSQVDMDTQRHPVEFPLTSGIFAKDQPEYNAEDEDAEDAVRSSPSTPDVSISHLMCDGAC